MAFGWLVSKKAVTAKKPTSIQDMKKSMKEDELRLSLQIIDKNVEETIKFC